MPRDYLNGLFKTELFDIGSAEVMQRYASDHYPLVQFLQDNPNSPIGSSLRVRGEGFAVSIKPSPQLHGSDRFNGTITYQSTSLFARVIDNTDYINAATLDEAFEQAAKVVDTRRVKAVE